jgi:hypothetical protein
MELLIINLKKKFEGNGSNKQRDGRTDGGVNKTHKRDTKVMLFLAKLFLIIQQLSLNV